MLTHCLKMRKKRRGKPKLRFNLRPSYVCFSPSPATDDRCTFSGVDILLLGFSLAQHSDYPQHPRPIKCNKHYVVFCLSLLLRSFDEFSTVLNLRLNFSLSAFHLFSLGVLQYFTQRWLESCLTNGLFSQS